MADPTALATVVAECRTYGFDLPRHNWPDDEGFARCTLVAHSAQVDLLCPDDATEGQLVAGEARSLAIPGGRRALEAAEPVTVLLGDDWAPVDVRVPTLFGALAVKAAAATDPRTRDQSRHLEDVAFLLSIIDDPRRLHGELTDQDRALLGLLVGELRQGDSVAWAHLDARQDSPRKQFLPSYDTVGHPWAKSLQQAWGGSSRWAPPRSAPARTPV